jgi:peptidoglycan-associated lipoprotein
LLPTQSLTAPEFLLRFEANVLIFFDWGVLMKANVSVSAGILLFASVVLLLESSCARWINGNTGEKGMQSGHGRPDAAGKMSSGDRPQSAAEDIPSLSQFQPSNMLSLGKNTGEERIPNDIVAISPSTSSGIGSGGDGGGLSPEERRQGERLAALAGLQDVFFGYDSSTVSDDARERLLHAAHWLHNDSSNKLLIEGHCDERGTIAYNLVLGEKRARALLAFLRDQQLDAGRLTVVSYGKERPFCRNHDESCYRQNRRGHFVVRH